MTPATLAVSHERQARSAQRGPGRWSDRWANVIEAGLVNGLGHVSIEAHRANHLLSWVGQR